MTYRFIRIKKNSRVIDPAVLFEIGIFRYLLLFGVIVEIDIDLLCRFCHPTEEFLEWQ